MAWTQLLCLDGELARAEPKRLRYCLFHTAAVIVRSGRRTSPPPRRRLALGTGTGQRLPPAPNPAVRRLSTAAERSSGDHTRSPPLRTALTRLSRLSGPPHQQRTTGNTGNTRCPTARRRRPEPLLKGWG